MEVNLVVTTVTQNYIPTIRSNKPMAIAGAIVQNEFHHRRKVYSKTLALHVSETGMMGGLKTYYCELQEQ